MILEDKRRVTSHYDKNEVLPNVEGVVVSMQEYRANRRKIHDCDIHHALHADMFIEESGKDSDDEHEDGSVEHDVEDSSEDSE
uniref:Uncharacterized protein n=1 Tax=Lactuca sativa TaxID=4236 RepID=A0A9R1VFA8_LACSA|nr:hypothetical protein LSAT_V11C500292250 [Lactuca sativa]